jgi:hypothetical protein
MASPHNPTRTCSKGVNGRTVERKSDSDVGIIGNNNLTSMRKSQRLRAKMEGKMHTSIGMEPNWSEKQEGQTLDDINSGFSHIASSTAKSCNEESSLPHTTARDVMYNLRSKRYRSGASIETSSREVSPKPTAGQEDPPSEVQTQTFGANTCSSRQENDAVQCEPYKSRRGRVVQLQKVQPEQEVVYVVRNSHISYEQVLTDVEDSPLSRTQGGARKRTAFGQDNEITQHEGADHVDKIETLTDHQQYRDGRENHDLISQETNKRPKRGNAGDVIPIDKEEREKKKLKVGGKNLCTGCGMSVRNAFYNQALAHCLGVFDTPNWRKGPTGPRTLCNACGLRWAEKEKRTFNDGRGRLSKLYVKAKVAEPRSGRSTSNARSAVEINRQNILSCFTENHSARHLSPRVNNRNKSATTPSAAAAASSPSRVSEILIL